MWKRLQAIVMTMIFMMAVVLVVVGIKCLLKNDVYLVTMGMYIVMLIAIPASKLC